MSRLIYIFFVNFLLIYDLSFEDYINEKGKTALSTLKIRKTSAQINGIFPI
jgi:hypothetical protein